MYSTAGARDGAKGRLDVPLQSLKMVLQFLRLSLNDSVVASARAIPANNQIS